VARLLDCYVHHGATPPKPAIVVELCVLVTAAAPAAAAAVARCALWVLHAAAAARLGLHLLAAAVAVSALQGAAGAAGVPIGADCCPGDVALQSHMHNHFNAATAGVYAIPSLCRLHLIRPQECERSARLTAGRQRQTSKAAFVSTCSALHAAHWPGVWNESLQMFKAGCC
jgi:hypothetical protein